MKERPRLPKPPQISDGVADADIYHHGLRCYDAGERRGREQARVEIVARAINEVEAAGRTLRNAEIVRAFLNGEALSEIIWEYGDDDAD